MNSLLVGAVAVVSLISSGGANAEEQGVAGTRPPLVAAGAGEAQDNNPADTGKEERAAALYREAEAKYSAGDLAGALAQMQACYEVSGLTELLFNLGQLHQELEQRHQELKQRHQELEQCEQARDTYREYLARNPQPSRGAEAKSALDKLLHACPDRPPEQVLVPRPPRVPLSSAPVRSPRVPVTPRYWTPLRTVGWSAIAAATLAGSGALYLAMRAANDETELEQRLRALQSSESGFDRNDKRLENAGKRNATWARVLGLSASGFVAAGVTLLVLGNAGHAAQTPPAVSLEVGESSLWARYSHPF